MMRIVERLGLETEEDAQFLVDLISATFTRGIEFGAVEVAAQQIELGQDVGPAQIDIAPSTCRRPAGAVAGLNRP